MPMNRFLGAMIGLASLAMLGGCSETGAPPAPVPEAPQVKLLYPPAGDAQAPDISDSVEVYVGVESPQGDLASEVITQVRFFFARRNKSTPDTIGVETQPVDPGLVPAEIQPYIQQLEPGWSLYKRWWYTGPQYRPPKGTYIASGEYVSVFAIATDKGGAQGRSDLVRVRILNLGEDLYPPDAQFVVTPSSGTTETVFSFDPNYTTDNVDTNDLISVRWDFDGNPQNGWDIDWDQGAMADQVQTWQFAAPKSYLVVLEARNSYLPDSVGQYHRPLQVENPGGRPNPPDPENYVEIPAGTYTMGATNYVLDDTLRTADSDEGPVHPVEFKQSFMISKYEVSNRVYLDYINAALADSNPRIQFDQGAGVLRYVDRQAPVDTTWTFLKLESDLTQIYYDLDHAEFRVQAGYEDHPVTGVTYRGAAAFCLFYGLRLPSEAEWEVAARGDHADYSYPFGIQLSRTDGGRRANYRASRTAPEPFAEGTTPVGFFNGQVYEGFQTVDSPSVFGLYDMAGNVSEWVSDWFGDYGSALEIDPQGPLTGTFKVVRGGNYNLTRVGIRCTARDGEDRLETGFSTIGFRPAYSIY